MYFEQRMHKMATYIISALSCDLHWPLTIPFTFTVHTGTPASSILGWWVLRRDWKIPPKLFDSLVHEHITHLTVHGMPVIECNSSSPE